MTGQDRTHELRTVVRPLVAAEAGLLLDDPRAFTAATGLELAHDYLAFPEALPRIVADLQAGQPPEWGSHLVIDPTLSTVVGFGGYKGAPDAGTVEVGYSVAPAHRNRGHARNAVVAWVHQAARAGVRAVLAHTLPTPNASTRVLEHCGFLWVGNVPDDDGHLWQWRLAVQRAFAGAAVSTGVSLEQALELAGGRHESTLTTLRRDGRPHLANVLHVVGEDLVIRVSTSAGSRKYTHLARIPWAALHINGPDFYSYAVLEGNVTLSAVATSSDDDVVHELMAHYRAMRGEPDEWDGFQAMMVRERRLVVRPYPTRGCGFRLQSS